MYKKKLCLFHFGESQGGDLSLLRRNSQRLITSASAVIRYYWFGGWIWCTRHFESHRHRWAIGMLSRPTANREHFASSARASQCHLLLLAPSTRKVFQAETTHSLAIPLFRHNNLLNAKRNPRTAHKFVVTEKSRSRQNDRMFMSYCIR